MNKFKRVGAWALASLCALPSISMAKNGFLVAPGILEINVDELKTHSFIVTNTGDDPIRLSVDPIYLPIDHHTMNAGTHLRPGVAEEENIVDKVRVSPRKLSLRPGERRYVRVQVRPLKDKEPGDYRAHLLVKMQEVAYTSSTKSENQAGMSLDLDIRMEAAVALYGRKGNPRYRMDLACEKSEAGAFRVSVANPTEWRFEGMLSSGNTDETPLVVLRESVRKVAFDLSSDLEEIEFTLTDLNGAVAAEVLCTGL